MKCGDQICENDLCVLFCGIHEKSFVNTNKSYGYFKKMIVHMQIDNLCRIECSIFISINRVHDSI